MPLKTGRSAPYFLLLLLCSLSLIGLGSSLIFYRQTWVATLWQACQSSLQHLSQNLYLVWQLTLPLLLLLIVARAMLNSLRQIRATWRLTQAFLPLRQPVPLRLHPLLAAHNLPPDRVVFLELDIVHAFCLGIWRPRIWLTAGLVDLLSAEELAAVVAHEVYHYQHRDPLRLLIGRTLKSAFFFLPIIHDLAQAAELQQELAADQAAVAHLADDLPLLCALQKLLRHPPGHSISKLVAYAPFNLTEARLRRLLYPPDFPRWPRFLSKLLINLGVILVVGSSFLISAAASAQPNDQVGPCLISPSTSSQEQLLLSSYY